MYLKGKKILVFIFVICYINAIPCIGKDPSNRSGLTFWTVGNIDGINKRFGTHLYQTLAELQKNKTEFDCFLLALAEQPLAERDIMEKCTLPTTRVYQFITTLKSLNLIKKSEKERWTTSVPVITDKQMERVKESMIPLAQKVVQYLKNEVPKIKIVYEKEKSATDPAWEKVAHLIIDKLIVDATFHRAIGILEREKGFKQYYSQDQKHIPAFFLELGPNYSTFGTNWYRFEHDKKKREVYILHGALFKRFVIRFNRYRDDQNFSYMLHRITPDGHLKALTIQEKKVFKELDWIEKDRLLVPILQAKNIRIILPDIEKIGRNAAEIVFKNYSIILNSFNNSPYAKFMDASGDYIQVCYHVLFSEIIEQLIVAGVLPPIPESVPEHFGVFITIGSVFE